MLKNISNLGNTISKQQQQEISGGMKPFGEVVCNAPYFKSSEDEPCNRGYHPHPTMGHCICCRD